MSDARTDRWCSSTEHERAADARTARERGDRRRRSQALVPRASTACGYWHAPLEGERDDGVAVRLLEPAARPISVRTSTPDGIAPPGLAAGRRRLAAILRRARSSRRSPIEAYFALKLAGLGRRRAGAARARATSSSGTAGSLRPACSRASGSRSSASSPPPACRTCRSSSMLLPSWFPLNIYAMSSWARETVVRSCSVMTNPPHGQARRRRGASTSSGSARRRDADVRFAALAASSSSWTQRVPRHRSRARAAQAESRGSRSAAARSRAPIEWILRAPGLDRAVGRHPAADAELRARAAQMGFAVGSPGRHARHPGHRRLPRSSARARSCSSRACRRTGTRRSREGAARRRRRAAAPDARARGRLAGRASDLPARRLVGLQPAPRARRLGVRVRERLVSRRRRLAP